MIMNLFYFFLMLLPVLVCGQTEMVIPHDAVGARAAGMGGAHTALVRDLSAIFWNPAGLSGMRRHEISSTFQYQSLTGITGVNNGPNRTGALNTLRLQQIGIGLPVPTLRGSLVFGLGYTRHKSMDYIQRLEDETYQAEGFLSQWTLAGAVALSDGIAFGAGLSLNRGIDKVRDEFNSLVVYNNSPDTFNLIGTETDYSGFGASFGLQARLIGPFRTGLSVEYSGDIESRYKEERYAGDVHVASYKNNKMYQLPLRLQYGLALEFPRFCVEIDITYIPWENYSVRYKDRNTDFPVTGLHTAVDVAAGVEYLIPFDNPRLPGIQLRLGGKHFGNPDSYYNYTENGKNRVSGGFGLLLEKSLMVDVAAQYVFAGREYTDSYYSGSDRFEEFVSVKKALVTLAYRY